MSSKGLMKFVTFEFSIDENGRLIYGIDFSLWFYIYSLKLFFWSFLQTRWLFIFGSIYVQTTKLWFSLNFIPWSHTFWNWSDEFYWKFVIFELIKENCWFFEFFIESGWEFKEFWVILDPLWVPLSSLKLQLSYFSNDSWKTWVWGTISISCSGKF